MRLPIVALTLTLTACAWTRLDLQTSGHRREFMSAMAPRAVAECMARNGDENVLIDSSRISTGEEPHTIEYISRNSISGAFILAVIEPASTGSRVSTYVNSDAVMLISQDQAELLMKDC